MIYVSPKAELLAVETEDIILASGEVVENCNHENATVKDYLCPTCGERNPFYDTTTPDDEL